MKFTKTTIQGVTLTEPEPHSDTRGFFARGWCANEFESQGLNTNLCQCNISFNHSRGTLRGLHFQKRPYEESKLVRCTRGSIFDVVVDIRRDSPTFLQWVGVNLTADNYKSLYIPEGTAHGYITLEDNTEVYYQVSEFYKPEASVELHWDDPDINISWPIKPTCISQKDSEAPFVFEYFQNLPDGSVK